MKKVICILFSFLILLTSVFADKSSFYENGKAIDTLYVDSEDGLKVRDCPSLKSNRLCAVPHRLPVKVVAIGKEEAIDGITAPWVEILLPRYEWKSDNPEYGWVFGGYLNKEIPAFISPKTKANFEIYLQSMLINIPTEYFHDKKDCYGASFMPEAQFFFFKDKTFYSEIDVACGDIYEYVSGTYECLSENTVKLKYDNTELVLCFDKIKEREYKIKILNSNCWYETFRTYNTGYIGDRIFNHLVYSYDTYNKTYFSYFEQMHDYQYGELGIKYGASCKNIPELYEKYRAYWDPIMKEHQEKADMMR